MVVETFSWPNLNERMWPDWCSNQWPLDSQSDSLMTALFMTRQMWTKEKPHLGQRISFDLDSCPWIQPQMWTLVGTCLLFKTCTHTPVMPVYGIWRLKLAYIWHNPLLSSSLGWKLFSPFTGWRINLTNAVLNCWLVYLLCISLVDSCLMA